MRPKSKKALFLWIPIAWILAATLLSGCAHLERQAEPENETQILLDFFENERDYLHDGGSFVITAQSLRTNLLTKPDKQYLMDIRSPEAFARGHIEGSVHVDIHEVYNHIKEIDAASYENIVLVCFAGQATAYQASLLRAAGYDNVVSLKYGISSWNHVFAEKSWLRNISSARVSEFVHTESPPKNTAGPLPRLDTGKTDPEEILEARLAKLFKEGFGPVMIGQCCLFHNCYSNGGYYIINYWTTDLYRKQGHIPGAVNYPPGDQPFKSENDLLTLSTEIPNVIYCFTGQTSAYVAGYLRILGYDARSILFGANSMIYDRMRDNKVPNTFLPDKEIMNYEYVSGE